jgi:NADPH:quinone reductase-like Zn-dependent oxidoreductase
VHGGTSSVGMKAITIAKDRGLTVLASTRQASKRGALEAAGADHVIVSDGEIAPSVREIVPDGVDGLCELVGPGSLVDALRAVAPTGSACITGFLEGQWDTTRSEAEAERIGVPLRRFGSGAIDRGSCGAIFQEIVRGAEDGRYRVAVDRTVSMHEIAEAPRYMEENRAAGKIVVLPPDG